MRRATLRSPLCANVSHFANTLPPRTSHGTDQTSSRTAITPEQFEELSDEQLAKLVPKAYREFFPGKDFCADGHFYLHDGTAWSFFRGGFLDE